MPLTFKGSQAELEALVQAGGFTGTWCVAEDDRVEFRSDNGAVLSWWPNSPKRTVSVQGAQRLNRQYAPRRLTQAQQLVLKEISSKRHQPPPWPIQIHSLSGDAESASFGIHLAEAISAAGWPAQHENMAFFGAPHGLQVRVPAGGSGRTRKHWGYTPHSTSTRRYRTLQRSEKCCLRVASS